MRKIKLTRQEKAIEDTLEEYVEVGKEEFNRIARIIEVRKRDAVLDVRINSSDLKNLKQKAARLGIQYQTFISEILHKIAQA